MRFCGSFGADFVNEVSRRIPRFDTISKLGMNSPRETTLPGILLLVVVACAIVGGLAWLIPSPTEKPIGDAVQVGTGQHRGVVVKVHPRHHFPDGTIREGWLLRWGDGVELWVPRDQMKKAELVKR